MNLPLGILRIGSLESFEELFQPYNTVHKAIQTGAAEEESRPWRTSADSGVRIRSADGFLQGSAIFSSFKFAVELFGTSDPLKAVLLMVSGRSITAAVLRIGVHQEAELSLPVYIC